jgi:hypothetical protein
VGEDNFLFLLWFLIVMQSLVLAMNQKCETVVVEFVVVTFGQFTFL